MISVARSNPAIVDGDRCALMCLRWVTRISVLGSAIDGGVAGFKATGAMTTFLAGAQRLGLLGKMPPKRIVGRALDAVGAGGKVTEPQLDALTAVAHFGFGVASGALFGVIRRSTRALPGPGWLQGALFGAAMWTVSYQGWVPSLGILPPPKRDRPGRPTSMFVSHLIYGAALGSALDAYETR